MNTSQPRDVHGAAHRAPDVHLEMYSDPRFLSGIRLMLQSICEKLGLSPASCSQVTLAVDEALCNVIRHGYQRRHDAPIWLSFWALADDGRGPGVRIVIEDEAEQIEPDLIKGRDLADIRPGGLGVHIIRQVMDVASYEKRSPIGMRLTLVKYDRPQSGAAGSPPVSPCGAPSG